MNRATFSTAVCAVLVACISFAAEITCSLGQGDPGAKGASEPIEAPVSQQTGKPLEGQVRGAALLTEDGLVKIGETAADLQRACLQVMGEVTRKDVVAVRPPNVLPGGVVIPAAPNVTGTIPLGSLAPRPRLLNRFVADTAYQVQLLQNEVDALIVPEEKMPSLFERWMQVRRLMMSVQSRLANLKSLAKGPRYDNAKIGREALAIYDHMKQVRQLQRELLKIVQSG